jgi:hypothetical protein
VKSNEILRLQVARSSEVDIRATVPKFVSRAGLKLEKALDHFEIDVSGLTALDAGLSTGGFTDCLLQRGARKVLPMPSSHLHVFPVMSSIYLKACPRGVDSRCCAWPDIPCVALKPEIIASANGHFQGK